MSRPAFTLIELLVVIVVFAILATLVAPNDFRHVGAANDTTATSQLELMGAALDASSASTWAAIPHLATS